MNSFVNPVVAALLASPLHRLLSRSVVALRITGRRSGRSYIVPVQYAGGGLELVVFPAGFERKTWWRNFREPAGVRVLLRGAWRDASARLVTSADGEDYRKAVEAYRGAFPRVTVPPEAPLVVLTVP